MKNPINIVYSTDENGVEQLYVSLFSLLRNKKQETSYTITIFCKNFNDSIKNNLLKIVGLFQNSSINFIDFKQYEDEYQLANIEMNKEHFLDLKWPAPTYYRLFIPWIFPDEEKVIYIDIDTLVLKDLTNLYNTDVTGYVAGVQEYAISSWIQWNNEAKRNGEYVNPKHIYNHFDDGSTDYDKHVQAGVLVFNIKKWLNLDLKKFIDVARKLNLNDQDLMNYLFRTDITFIPDVYNLCLNLWSDKNIDLFNEWYKITPEQVLENFQNGYIYHFSIKTKPDWILNSTTFDALLTVGSVEKFTNLMLDWDKYSIEYGYKDNMDLQWKFKQLSEPYKFEVNFSPKYKIYKLAFDKWFEYAFELYQKTNIKA